MESLLQAKSTAPKSQRVNYKKAAGIQMYAKLRNREIMLNTVCQIDMVLSNFTQWVV